jgi:mono/diheme cytochrome c family protein
MSTFTAVIRPLASVTRVVATFSLVVAAGVSVALAADPAGNAAHGKQLYMDTGCYQCHGTRGAGGAGPRLAPTPLPIEAYKIQLRHPRIRMPVYTAVVMSDADVADIYAYLLSIPKAKTAAEIPILKAIATPP